MQRLFILIVFLVIGFACNTDPQVPDVPKLMVDEPNTPFVEVLGLSLIHI